MKSFLQCFGEAIVSSNFEETKGYSPGVFFFAVQNTLLRKVFHFKVLEKRKRMALVSVA